MKEFNNLLRLILVAVLLITCDTEKDLDAAEGDFFVKYYGDTGNQEGVDMVINSDGTIFLLGNSSGNSRGTKFFVVKIDASGKILKQKYFGDADQASDEVAVDIEAAYDGDFIIAIKKRVSATERDIKLLRISAELEGVDSTIYPFAGDVEVRSVTTLLTNPRGFLLTGSTSVDVSGGATNASDPFCFRTDEQFNPNPLWKAPGGFGQDIGVKIVEGDVTNEFFLFFSTNQTSAGDFGFRYIGINNDGSGFSNNVELSEDNSTDERLNEVTKIGPPSNGYALIGTTSSGADPSNIYCVITNSSFQIINQGNQILTTGISGSLSGISITPASVGNSGFFVLGNQDVTIDNNTNRNLILFHLDAQGKVLWSVPFGSEFFDSSAKVLELPDGKILVLGTVTLGNQEKMVLIKVNSEGQFAK